MPLAAFVYSASSCSCSRHETIWKARVRLLAFWPSGDFFGVSPGRPTSGTLTSWAPLFARTPCVARLNQPPQKRPYLLPLSFVIAKRCNTGFLFCSWYPVFLYKGNQKEKRSPVLVGLINIKKAHVRAGGQMLGFSTSPRGSAHPPFTTINTW